MQIVTSFPRPSTRWLERNSILFVFLIGFSIWIGFTFYTRNTLEDAYITYRYANNLASGEGFVFNSGEKVLGTTTPLLTLMLALGVRIVGTQFTPNIATIVMIASGLAAGLVTYAALVRAGLSNFASALAAAVFYLHPFVILASTGGMETPLVLLLMATSLYFLTAEKYTRCSIALALLVLTRIDGIVWAGLVFLAILLKNRKFPFKQFATFGMILTPWIVFALSYFGSVMPHSVVAKQSIASGKTLSGFQDATSVNRFLEWFVSSSGLSVGDQFFPLLVLSFTIGVASVLRNKRSRILSPLIVFIFLFPTILFAGHAPIKFFWYLVPVGWCILIIASIGIWRVGILRKYFAAKNSFRYLPVIAATIVFGAFVFSFVQSDLKNFEDWRWWQEENEDGLRRVVGRYLRQNTPRNAKVAMEAIGYQGYYSQRYVIDLAGMTSPAVVAIYRESNSNAEAFYEILQRLEPDYIVLRTYEVDENIAFDGGLLFESPEQQNYFMSTYEEEKRFSTPIPGAMGELGYLTLYKRKNKHQ